ncbi:MAG: bifunctional hydroxymethylpyrimidine kinase/phosphomethylpyrimidine kinase [Candidatus Latescibacteria bacterium]|nr:bifunctional hydroxymethylpyrimidine kinase/phosphomethylpyrimidine kinase [Candidatus Latescibacterota bacterium]
MKQVLTIAGSDSGGGAGIQADLKAFHANGVFGMSVITSVTAQNTCEVRAAFDLPEEIIRAQISAVFDDFDVAAVKTGMLSSQVIVDVVVDELKIRKPPSLVVDPVMVSTSGFKLLNEDAIQSVKGNLLSLSTLVTPNRHEAELLAGMEIRTREDAGVAAKQIAELGASAVLVKGGHLDDESAAVDVLWDGEKEAVFESLRFDTKNTHGTGCTYSSAIAAHLAKGCSLEDAVGHAKHYITEAIRYGLDIGKGHGPTNHFYFLDATPK